MSVTHPEPLRLTMDDQALIHLVAKGRNNDDIAAELDIPLWTVKTRLKRLHRRISGEPDGRGGAGITTRARMVVWAYENGLMGSAWETAQPPEVEPAPPKPAPLTPLMVSLLEVCRAIVADEPRGDLRRLAREALREAGVRR